MEIAIRLQGLVRSYNGIRAVDGIDLEVPPGSILGLLGPNGAGKTTIVRMLSTLIAPDAGMAEVGGFDVVRDAERVREIIGLTGQYASVDEKLTGRENLLLIARLLGLGRRHARRRADELLGQFHLQDAAKRPVQTYSGGMRRRLDLAASLVGNPAILFLDEPTTGLDPRARRALWRLVGELREQGTTVLLTTQYLDEADALADRIVVLDRGRIIAEGTSAELKERVGGRSLFVVVADSARVDEAAKEIARIVGERPQTRDNTLNVAVTSSAVVPRVLRALDQVGIEAVELGLRTASLDDVFLALTGHAAEATSEMAEEGV
ncbi:MULTISPECIES: daunorubicin resistance protein DrrA family ABC transporter ATP-binding protein [unclassified Thioalkalivibrio]|uniref:daunorubicin resistance protein DrrA family ABC transporter ATP-binding protein n=1 Tax=unclassified Thioalkalivibrio TaxID=2621013 RepID=UPI00036E45D8|nr:MULTISPECIES: daunorubicin resistance protein DrrA family ABC transporter ATP-binding protein [unclassified Thioalkalivibrio]